MTSFPHFSKNGEILPVTEAHISLSSIEFAYGFGVYETIRIAQSQPYFLAQHIDRLLLSANIIGLKHAFTADQIIDYCQSLLTTISEPAFNLKMLLIGAQKPENVTLAILPVAPYFPKAQWYRDGIPTITARYERLFPQAKTLNMLGSYIAYQKAKESGCYDALLINNEGFITEGTRTNFFTMKDRTIFTPPEKDILPGITRSLVSHVARQNNFTIIDKNIAVKNFPDYDSAFLTSTSSKILPINRIDEYQWKKVSEPLIELIDAYDVFLKESKGVLDQKVL